MSGTRTAIDPQAPSARLAQAFAEMVVRLHRAQGGAERDEKLVEGWARGAWSAAAGGHACIDLEVQTGPGAPGAAMAALDASPAVTADPVARPAPLVLDEGALYLHRLWRAESGLAAALSRLDGAAPLADPPALDAALAPLFPGAPAGDPQLRAARAGLERRLVVVSGGPGTGKTTTMARLLVGFLRLRPDARVAFAAPTGKAAQRLALSLAGQLPALDPQGALATRMPTSGSTVHRLLGLGRAVPGRAPAERPLPFDLVIVDEASMLDLELAARLVAAIPPGGRLVLAGDMDQLASVDAGAVFADLCASGVAGIVRLERNYRQADAPHLVALAGAMRRGDASALADAVSGLDPPPMRAEVGRVADAALVGYETAVGLVEAGGGPLDVLAAYDRYRVLTALRDGEAGARGVNAAIAARLRRRLGLPAQTDWYAGRLVMVGRNEPGLGLYNGDIGVCLPGPDGGLAVAFDAGGKPRWLPLLQMPACEDAFAITVHKSQGSEFETVALLPAAAGHPLNTRELIYTGITRARRGLQLWADLETLQAAAANRTQRHGRLAARLAAQSGAPAGNGPPGG